MSSLTLPIIVTFAGPVGYLAVLAWCNKVKDDDTKTKIEVAYFVAYGAAVIFTVFIWSPLP